jgi:hypothetical protein
MRKLPISLLACSCLAAIGSAAPVDAQRAATVAQAQLAGSRPHPDLDSVTAMAPLADGSPALWLATFQGGGFVWLRADDRLPPLAAWSETGAVPSAIDHPALQDWLELQRLDAAWSREQNWTHPEAAAAWQALEEGRTGQRVGESVTPMLQSTWDQGWPWNQFCPVELSLPGGHVWTGCVATAMAQLMYFWNWPDYGSGSHGYTDRNYGWQFADFGAATYDWAAMTPGQGTPAAALLQYHCGVAVEMQYAPDGSGAFIGTGRHNALLAFENHFRYPSKAEFIQHVQLPGVAWAQRFTEELVAGRPVLDSGYGSGGHAFIVDGLQDGLFHLNWGWSGYLNGWFEIEALTPGGMEFSLQQGALIGLERDTPPVVEVPDQVVQSGQDFALIQLDAYGSDPQEAPEALDWWLEENPPLLASFDLATRTVLVDYPTGWTGSAELNFCALDPQGLWDCHAARFTVLPAVLVPAAVQDLRLTVGAGGTRLDWTAPTTDNSGLWPVQLTGFAIHRSTDPWFQAGPGTLRMQLGAQALSWTDPEPGGAPQYYRVVALGAE